MDERKIINKLKNKKGARYYICANDPQGADFAVGRLQTAGDWLETALDWAYSDDYDGVYDELLILGKKGNEQDIIDYIVEFWQLDIVEFNNKNVIEHLNDILEDDDSETGGTSCSNEILAWFIEETFDGDVENLTLENINKKLKECGIKEIE